MRKVLKYLKPYSLPIILSFILLFGQAINELSLPSLMSDIVNVGIQQGGIEETSPKAISENGFNLLSFFMSSEDRELVKDSYTLVTGSSSEADKYIESYPKLSKENIYV